jgi:hypothetical protein
MRIQFAILVSLMAVSCKDNSEDFRGPGLSAASLSVGDQVSVYRATLAGSFPMEDPALSLMLDTMFVPRSSGLEGGTPLPAALRDTLKLRGIVRGECQVPVRRQRQPLICEAQRAGYAVRLSEPLQLGTDSVQVYLVVEQYATPIGNRAERLRFERAYHVVRRGSGWNAVREARMPQP